MRTIEINLYKYNELTDEAAKERARDWYRQGHLDYEWWDHVYDMAKEAGAILGIDIDNIYFSGFWSQGDGACFEGSYSYRKGWRKELQQHFGGETLAKLERIGLDLQDAQAKAFYKLSASVAHTGGNYHHLFTYISVDHEDRRASSHEEGTITDALSDFMGWIYDCLESEHDYLTSDESVEEGLIVNEYEFTEEGEIH